MLRSRVVGLVVLFVFACSGCTWSMFGFDAHHTRFNPAAGTPNVSTVGSVVLKRTAATSGSIYSSPAVANGVVYVGSNDNKLYAFDAAGHTNCSGIPKTCTPLWTATTGARVVSSPAVANGVVYVGSFDNKLYAFDAAGTTGCSGLPKTCTPLWTGTTGGFVWSSPGPAGGVVYVGSNDANLYAYGLP